MRRDASVGSDDVTKRRSMMVVVTRPVLVGMGTGSMGTAQTVLLSHTCTHTDGILATASEHVQLHAEEGRRGGDKQLGV